MTLNLVEVLLGVGIIGLAVLYIMLYERVESLEDAVMILDAQSMEPYEDMP